MWLFLIALALAFPVVEVIGELILRRGSKRDLGKMIEHRKLGHAFDPTSGKWSADELPALRTDGSTKRPSAEVPDRKRLMASLALP